MFLSNDALFHLFPNNDDHDDDDDHNDDEKDVAGCS